MDNEAEAKLDAVNNAVQGLATLLDKDGAMCTSWVLVSEWIDSDGNFWFSTHSEPDLPIWRMNGMLSHAQVSVTNEHYTGGTINEGDNS